MEIENYKPMNNGYLKAKFDVIIAEWGLTIRDCCLFDKNGTKWVSMPSRKYQDTDGSSKYFTFVAFEKTRKARFETSCLEKLAKFESMASAPEEVPTQSNDLPF